MNEEVIKTLYEEREKLYPNGLPIRPRGYGKIYLYMSHLLRYTSYDFACDICKSAGCVDEKMSLDDVHKIMDDYINKICNKLKEGF